MLGELQVDPQEYLPEFDLGRLGYFRVEGEARGVIVARRQAAPAHPTVLHGEKAIPAVRPPRNSNIRDTTIYNGLFFHRGKFVGTVTALSVDFKAHRSAPLEFLPREAVQQMIREFDDLNVVIGEDGLPKLGGMPT